MSYLEFYYNHPEQDSYFLCNFFSDDELFKLFDPTNDELISFAKSCRMYRFYEKYEDLKSYNPAWGSWKDGMRETILLLMAAMNDEL